MDDIKEKIKTWSEILSEMMTRKVKISRLSKKIGFSKEEIFDLLKNAGYEVHFSKDFLLEEKHLKIISKAYVNSIKAYYHTSSIKYHKLNFKEQKELRKFFSRFINRHLIFRNIFSRENTLDKVLGGKLDTTLIEYHFETIISNLSETGFYIRSSLGFYDSSLVVEIENEDEKIFIKHGYKIKVKIFIKHLFNCLVKEIRTILICHHYHIFQGEEDKREQKQKRVCFSLYKNTVKEALNINNIKLFHSWKKTLKFS